MKYVGFNIERQISIDDCVKGESRALSFCTI